MQQQQQPQQTQELYSAAQYADLLHQVLSCTNNDERRATEALVVRSLGAPANLRELVLLLCQDDLGNVPGGGGGGGIRQLAAVLLRKKIFTLWRALPPADRVGLRAMLLERLGTEPVRQVRFSVAHIIVRLAKSDSLAAASAAAAEGDDAAAAAAALHAWPELHHAVRAASEDPRPDMRELAMVLLYSFAEILEDGPDTAAAAGKSKGGSKGAGNGGNMTALAAESVARGLADTELPVLTAAVRAAGMLIPALALQPALRATFIPTAVNHCSNILAQACQPQQQQQQAPGVGSDARDELYTAAIDLLAQVTQELTAKRHAETLVVVARTLMAVLGSPACSGRTRQAASAALTDLCEQKPKFIVAQQLLEPLVNLCLALMAEDDAIVLDAAMGGDDDDDDDGADDMDDDMLDVCAPCTNGGLLLGALGKATPQKTFTAVLLPFIAQATDESNARSASPRQKKAAMVALSVLSETNSGFLRRRVGYVLDITRRFLQAGDAEGGALPREAAAFALGYFCRTLHPEILTHHAALLPLLLPLLADPQDLVRRRAGDALDTICENMEEELEPYVPTLLPAVVGAIGASASLETQRVLCGVISAMGMTRCEAVRAHGPEILELLRGPLAAPAPAPGAAGNAAAEMMALRAQALETAGVIGAAMGKEAFAPYLSFFMQAVVASMRGNGSENANGANQASAATNGGGGGGAAAAVLREQAFGFLCNMCELLREDFLAYLDDSLTFALDSIAQDRTVTTNKHLLARGEGRAAAGAFFTESAAYNIHDDKDGADGGDGDGEDDDDDDEPQEIHLRVRTADVEEKSSAVYAVGVFAETLLLHFGLERVERCWGPVLELTQHYYEKIRSNAHIALAQLLMAAHGATCAHAGARLSSPPTPAELKALVSRSFEEDTVAAPVRALLEVALQDVFPTALEQETEGEVVGAVCEAIEKAVTFFGPQALSLGPDELVRLLLTLFRGRAVCQALDEDAEDGEAGDSEDEAEAWAHAMAHGGAAPAGAGVGGRDRGDPLFDAADAQASAMAEEARATGDEQAMANLLPTLATVWRGVVPPAAVREGMRVPQQHDETLDAAATVVDALAEAYGDRFAPYVPYFFEVFCALCGFTTRPTNDAIVALGSLATLVKYADAESAAAAAAGALQVAMQVLAECEESLARANACYLINILLQRAPQHFTAAVLPATLQALWSVIAAGTGGEEIPEAVDNAASATCTLVRTLPPQSFPFHDVVAALLPALPMRVDKAENKNAVETVAALLAPLAGSGNNSDNDGAAATVAGRTASECAWLPEVAACVGRVLLSRAIEEELKQSLVHGAVLPFAAKHPQVWAAAKESAALSPDATAALAQYGC